ncbi:MAG TPA: sulfite exporter TauE/SafE family protein [Gemmatimonadales bacterium]|jgi:sulfite exporter TauE/SafE
MMLRLLAAAFLAGLVGSAHCVGMCGAFAASCTRARLGLPAWHVGRIGTYALLGAAAGAAGQWLPGPGWVPAALATGLLLWFALALAGLVPEPTLVPASLARAGASSAAHPTTAAQLLFGVANGFLPCGLVYSALSIPVALARPVPGALAMAAFGAGTIPALTLAALGARRLLLGTLWRRRVFAVLVFSIGAWTIWTRANITASGRQHHHVAPPDVSQQ